MERRKRFRVPGQTVLRPSDGGRESALVGVVFSLLIVVPLTAGGILAVWAGLSLRDHAFPPLSSAQDGLPFESMFSWLPGAAACVLCSILWLAGGACILFGLGLLGDLWHADGFHLLNLWALTHATALGALAAAVWALHPEPAAFWHETRSVMLSVLVRLSIPWRIYLATFGLALTGSFLLVLSGKRVQP